MNANPIVTKNNAGMMDAAEPVVPVPMAMFVETVFVPIQVNVLRIALIKFVAMMDAADLAGLAQMAFCVTAGFVIHVAHLVPIENVDPMGVVILAELAAHRVLVMSPTENACLLELKGDF